MKHSNQGAVYSTRRVGKAKGEAAKGTTTDIGIP